jgi:hypothetical protein
MARLRLIPEVTHRPTVSNSALLALANRSPRLQINPTLLDGASSAPVSPLKPSQVVAGIGLSTALEEALTARVSAWIGHDHAMHAAKAMNVDLNGSVHDPRQRGEIARRFWRYWNSQKGDEKISLRLKKAMDFAGAELVLIAESLEKAAGHKYLKRVPTGKAKPKYRYIYSLPSRKGLVGDDELQAGTKVKVTHAGKDGHFNVQHHDRKKGIVRLKHDESGQTIHVKHHDLKRMVESYHAKKGTESQAAPKLELRRKPVQTEIKTPKEAAKKPVIKALQTVPMADMPKWHAIVGFAPSADQASQMAAGLSKDGHEYAAIQQPAGFAIVERKKAPKIKGEAVGGSTKVFMRDSSGKGIADLEAKYVVMEADKVIASHRPTENFGLHGDYPEDVQERRYEDLPGEQLKVQRIARRLEPQLVANTNPDAVNGAPVITENGVVLGGNGRAMGMQLAHASEPGSAKKLKQYLSTHAGEFGLSSQDVDQIENPILVRRVEVGKDTDTLRKLGRRMNESLTQGLDPRTAEVALGKNYVNRELVDVLVEGMEPDDSLADYLHSSKSRDFVSALKRSGIVDDMNWDEFVGDKGLLNEDGRSRVERVLAARFIPDAKLLSAMPQTLRQNIAKSTPYLLRAESAGWDLRESLKNAVKADLDFRANFKGSTKQYLAQKTLPGTEHPVEALHKDPMSGLLFNVVRDFNGSRKMPAGFRSFARRAEAAQHDKGGFAMFATAAETPTQALDRSYGITPEAKKELAGAAQAARDEQEALFARAGISPKQKRQATQELALSQSHWDDLFKSEAERPRIKAKHLPAYLMNAVVGELNHMLSASRNVAALKGRGLKMQTASIRKRLMDWLDYEMSHDAEIARAFGSQRVTEGTINGLIEAALKVHAGELKKAMPIGTTRRWADGKTYKKVAAGRWAEVSDLSPGELGLRLPQKGLAYKVVEEGKKVTSKIASKLPAKSDQPHANVDKLLEDAKATLPEFQRLVTAIGTATGGTIKHGPLKKRKRIDEKVEADYGGDASQVKDIVRSSLSYKKITDVYAALDKLSTAKGIEIVRMKDRMRKPIPGGYRDIMLNVQVGDHVCEVQLHLDSILQVKKQAHKLYAQARTIAAKVKADGRDRYSPKEMTKIAALTKKQEKLYGNAFRTAL